MTKHDHNELIAFGSPFCVTTQNSLHLHLLVPVHMQKCLLFAESMPCSRPGQMSKHHVQPEETVVCSFESGFFGVFSGETKQAWFIRALLRMLPLCGLPPQNVL